MESLFRLDHPVWVFLGKLADLFLLTVLWAVCSLPVITIGASTTALYYVTLKLAEDKEGSLFQSFFRAFRDNFKQSTLCWLIMIFLGLVLAGDLYICYEMRDHALAVCLQALFAVLAFLYLMVLTYLFPLLARCEAGSKRIFFLAFMMSMKQFGWSLLMLTISACILALGLFVQWLFLFLAAGLIAYLHAMILKHIFEVYHLELPEDSSPESAI